MSIKKGDRHKSLVFLGKTFHQISKGKKRLRIEVKCDCGKYFDIAKDNWGKQKKCSVCAQNEKAKVIPLPLGTKFGDLTATGNIKSIWVKSYKVPRTVKYHELICSCGKSFYANQNELKNRKSCVQCHKNNTKFYSLKHGKTKSIEYRMFQSAKHRAKKTGLRFEIELTDIQIPNFCPILGLMLDKKTFKNSNRKPSDNSPSLDRIDSNLGYIKKNIAVISCRANSIKNNGTIAEHELIAKFLEKYER